METILIEIGSYQLNFKQCLLAVFSILLWLGCVTLCKKKVWSFLSFKNNEVQNELKSLTLMVIHFIFILIILQLLGLNLTLLSSAGFNIKVIDIVLAIFIVQAMRSLDAIGVAMVSSTHEESESMPSKPRSSATRLVHMILFGIATLLLVNNFDLNSAYDLSIGSDNQVSISISNIIWAALIILIARLLYWIITVIFLQGFYQAKKVDKGVQFALNQLLGYVVFTIGIIIALQHLGINMNLIWAGAAALLVGVGIGLQQTFADFFAGITMLFERSVKMGDVLELDKFRGIVKKIGLRTSVLVTTEEKRLVIPNSKLTNNSVNNWSQNTKGLRFSVGVGVAYGSDTELVKNILLDVAQQTRGVLESPKPFVRFDNFGDSALVFSLHFYSKYYMQIENVQSDIRFKVDKELQKNNVTIPFPQRDIWIKKQ
jgi:small-conductance mechanosensitive channel